MLVFIYSAEMGHLFQGLRFILATYSILLVMAAPTLVTLNELNHPFHRGGGALKTSPYN